MRICILHNAVPADASLEDQDVLVQVAAVAEALGALGCETTTLECGLDLHALLPKLRALRPTAVFNLVEGLAGHDALSPALPMLLDALGVPYTGNTAEATFLTAHKLLGKRWMATHDLPTPPWLTAAPAAASSRAAQPGAGCRSAAAAPAEGDARWILKGVWEQASRNLDDEAIVVGDEAAVRRQLADWTARWQRPCYAERFIEGREFNLGLLTGPDGPQPLPPAEIDFSAFPAEKPRIVGYRAKWQEDSFEYRHTPRRFDFAAADAPLLAELRDLALRCWQVFELRGYARVDFRVDERGRPWILEVNTNPCLSPDAGFAAALREAGIEFAAAIDRIVTAAAGASGPALGNRPA